CLFFFSSRRRHTRFSRDWSSDVCSSDLAPTVAPARRCRAPGRDRRRAGHSSSSCRQQGAFAQSFPFPEIAIGTAPANGCGAPGPSLYIPLHDHTGTAMLQAIRSRAGSIIVKILFGLLIISFGFWGIFTRSDYYQGHSPDTVVATAGDQNIRAEELQRAWEPALERVRGL